VLKAPFQHKIVMVGIAWFALRPVDTFSSSLLSEVDHVKRREGIFATVSTICVVQVLVRRGKTNAQRLMRTLSPEHTYVD